MNDTVARHSFSLELLHSSVRGVHTRPWFLMQHSSLLNSALHLPVLKVNIIIYIIMNLKISTRMYDYYDIREYTCTCLITVCEKDIKIVSYI